MGKVLTQYGHPVMYISCRPSKLEKKYNNIEREGLAVVFVVTYLRPSLVGRKLNLKTDLNR